jgi:hypothetical protein
MLPANPREFLELPIPPRADPPPIDPKMNLRNPEIRPDFLRIDPAPYIGLPYRRGGRERPAVDCWGLVRLVYAEQLGIELDPHGDTVGVLGQIAAEARAWIPVPASELRTADVLLLRRIGRPFHVGVVIDPGLLLHTDEGHDAVLQPLARIADRFQGYRHPGLVPGRPPALRQP